MELWNTILTSEDILEIASCVKSSVKPQNRVVTWSMEEWTSIKMEPLKEIPLEDICKENPLVDQFIWPDKLNFVTLSYYCEIVEGEIRIVRTMRIFWYFLCNRPIANAKLTTMRDLSPHYARLYCISGFHDFNLYIYNNFQECLLS